MACFLRLSNWVQLCKESIKAEVPQYEIMSSMAMFLGMLHNNREGDDCLRRIATFFDFPPET